MHSGRAGTRRGSLLGRSRHKDRILQHLAHEAVGAPIPSGCNSLAIGPRLVRLLNRGVVIEVHVGSTNPPTRCNIRAIQVQGVRPIELDVAIDELVGCTKPQAQCKHLAEELANSDVVAGVLRRVPRHEGVGPVVAL